MYKICVLLYAFLFAVADGSGKKAEESSSNEEGGGDKDNTEQVVFGGKLELQSKPLPPDVTRNDMIRFFTEQKDSSIIIIASAGGDRPTERIERTSELERYWYETCYDTYGLENCLPNDYDPIFVTNTTTKYKSLFFQLTTTTYNGVKTIIPDTSDYSNNNDDDKEENDSSLMMPKYIFNMIAEQQHPEGLAPVVWAFHKICGFVPNVIR